MVKTIYWIGRSREVICRFVKSARAQIGYQLYRVQRGLAPTDWKPLKSVGPGAIEIRLHQPHEHRLVYVAKFGNAIYVLHAFEKKTQKTPKRDIEIAKKNYKELLRQLKGVS